MSNTSITTYLFIDESELSVKEYIDFASINFGKYPIQSAIYINKLAEAEALLRAVTTAVEFMRKVEDKND